MDSTTIGVWQYQKGYIKVQWLHPILKKNKHIIAQSTRLTRNDEGSDPCHNSTSPRLHYSFSPSSSSLSTFFSALKAVGIWFSFNNAWLFIENNLGEQRNLAMLVVARSGEFFAYSWRHPLAQASFSSPRRVALLRTEVRSLAQASWLLAWANWVPEILVEWLFCPLFCLFFWI